MSGAIHIPGEGLHVWSAILTAEQVYNSFSTPIPIYAASPAMLAGAGFYPVPLAASFQLLARTATKTDEYGYIECLIVDNFNRPIFSDYKPATGLLVANGDYDIYPTNEYRVWESGNTITGLYFSISTDSFDPDPAIRDLKITCAYYLR